MRLLIATIVSCGLLVGCSTFDVTNTNNNEQLKLVVDKQLLQPVKKPLMLQQAKQ